MSLNLAQVEHIAELARLELTEEEKKQYCGQLSTILEYAARLLTLDTRGIEPTASVSGEVSRLRPDEPRAGLSQADLFQNAQQIKQEQFRVPPVLE